ncbi:Uncharacterized protein Fot_39468 [Forsythia ovata]|uniref:XS domain-containing protein n=1 Tax=Forsythia ovata TaxID=205694 RepID=A0ABD1S4N7_9LAMI
MTCRKTMCTQPKLIPDISPGQSSWTAKVVVAEKNIARTAQRSPVKYQTMVLVDPQVCPPAKHKICKIKDIPVLLTEIKDYTGCIDATIMGEMAEAFLRSTAMTLINLTTPDKQSFIQAIRTSVDEEQILYVRATERDAEGTIVKYDIVYMFDPVTELDEPLDPRSAANNIVKSQPEHISRINKGKQIVKPVQRALFSLRDSYSSQGEKDGMPSATAIFNHSSKDRVSTIVTSSSEEDNNTLVVVSVYQHSNHVFYDILGVVIDVLPKKLVQTKYQRESCIQEIVLINEKFERMFLTAWDEFVVNECKTVTTMVGAALIILARNLRVSSFNGKIPLCQLCAILLYPERIILNDIRALTIEEHMLYLKVINNNKKTAALKYDVVFMLEPILDINTALNIGENSVRGFMVEEKSAYRTCINKQPIKAYDLPVLSPTDPVSGRHNAKHTCFKTNTVIASRNITDLRLVANIANQSFMMVDTNDGARIVKPWTVIVENIPVRTENNIRVDNCSINLKQRWKRQGYLISNFQPLYDYRGHFVFALVEFSRDIEGLKFAFLFDLSYVEKRKGKAGCSSFWTW